jgi:hypothetical protein
MIYIGRTSDITPATIVFTGFSSVSRTIDPNRRRAPIGADEEHKFNL